MSLPAVFGYKLETDNSNSNLPDRIVSKSDEESVHLVKAGGSALSYGASLDFSYKNDGDLITKYRQLSLVPEIEKAVDDIVNEAISFDEIENPVDIILDEIELPDRIKNLMINEFNYILNLMNFRKNGYNYFKRFYVDGRLFFHLVLNPANPSNGLVNIDYIDSKKIRKVVEEIPSRKNDVTGEVTPKSYRTYFRYDQGQNNTSLGMSVVALTNKAAIISEDAVSYVNSGIYDSNLNLILSHLHKAIRPYNQLRMLEDAVVIAKFTRAPQRRAFYIDVGNLSTSKAEQYVQEYINKYKNKLIYDMGTGEHKNDRKILTMLEDFWFPTRDGRGTKVENIPGDTDISATDESEYFRKKLYEALNMPVSRMEAENNFNIGRTSEITRDEIKFTKFIQRLRSRFSEIFLNMLRTQLVVKNILTVEEFDTIKNSIIFTYKKDNFFTELKNSEILNEKLNTLERIAPYVGVYFSLDYVKKKVLNQSDQEIKEITDQINADKISGSYDQFTQEFDDQNNQINQNAVIPQ